MTDSCFDFPFLILFCFFIYSVLFLLSLLSLQCSQAAAFYKDELISPSPRHSLFPAVWILVKYPLPRPCCGPSWLHVASGWPLKASLLQLVSLSFVPLPPAGQMFIYNAADKEKNFPFPPEDRRLSSGSLIFFLFPPEMRDSSPLSAVVTAFDGQGDCSCGSQCA